MAQQTPTVGDIDERYYDQSSDALDVARQPYDVWLTVPEWSRVRVATALYRGQQDADEERSQRLAELSARLTALHYVWTGNARDTDTDQHLILSRRVVDDVFAALRVALEDAEAHDREWAAERTDRIISRIVKHTAILPDWAAE